MPRFISKHPVCRSLVGVLFAVLETWRGARDVVVACPTCIGQSTPWTITLQCVVWKGMAMTVTSSAVAVGAVHFAR